jgi:molybdopterin converting factor subunit 1
MVVLQILLFARARELAGQPTIELSLPAVNELGEVLTLATVREALKSACPALASLLSSTSTLLALNASYVESEGSAAIKQGDEIAVIPPVSGG